MRKAEALIKRSALLHNYEMIKQMSHNRPVMAVLKANAYGHGLEAVASTLQHADSIGVAAIQEAILIRDQGINSAIVLLEGVCHPEEMDLVDQYNLELVVHNTHGLELLLQAHLSRPIRVWLKFDSGMHRLGFYEEDFLATYEALKGKPELVSSIILMTHLSNADDVADDTTRSQLQRFNAVTQNLDELRCVANSAATLAWPEAHYDYVRSGIMLFGCSPLLGGTGTSHQLKPAMNFESEVIAIKPLKAGDSVGYGATWSADHDCTLAIVCVGYGDGYPRHAKPGTPVWIAGQTYPLAGRVSMDMITVVMDEDTAVKIGDRVVLWGDELPVESVARCADTIPYQLLCGVTQRVEMTLVDR